MIVKLKIPWLEIIKDLRWIFLIIILYMTAISIVDYYLPLDQIHVPLALITVPGTVIGLLLAFRTNSAYSRWWEARIIWGSIVNDSRTWVRQLKSFVISHEETQSWIRKLAFRQIAWNYALSGHLRNGDPKKEIANFLDKKDLEQIETKTNIPNALLYLQAYAIKEAFQNAWITDYQFVEMDKTLTRLTDAMGKCERIKNTVFPSSYSYMVDLLIYLFIVFLPFGLVEVIGYVLIPTTISLAFSFLIIERIAIYMQDPFENRDSDTPMTALSRTIEINIREEIGDQQIPEPMRPVNGVLM